jgi:hypothetical protein
MTVIGVINFEALKELSFSAGVLVYYTNHVKLAVNMHGYDKKSTYFLRRHCLETFIGFGLPLSIYFYLRKYIPEV